jgi:gamma-glutamyltranspeptidase / glutathione hydrolase
MIRSLLALFALFVSLPAFAAGGVVSSADPRATEAGREILRAGGSAADAAMTMMLVLSVVEPQSAGIGGGGFFLYHDGRTGQLATIDARETAPAAARPDRFLAPDGKPLPFIQAWPGGLSVGVPGYIALAANVHRRWGKLSWSRLFEPAIHYANEWTVSRTTSAYLKIVAPMWKDFPDAQSLYWDAGQPKSAGATVRNPALAALLGKIAAEGPDAFYKGDNAQAIVDVIRKTTRNPGDMTLADLGNYRVKSRAPVCGAYRRYRICGMGPPSSGAVTVIQILKLLERFDMKALGPDNPMSWHLIGEAMQLAYADREKWLADADFVEVPVRGLIDAKYLKRRSAMISETVALQTYAAGQPPGAPDRTAAISSEIGGTTHFIAIDGRGNLASMTGTVESLFGSQLIANGMFLNNELTDFTFSPTLDGAPVANAVAGGKRPVSSMAPTIVYDARGKPVFAVGAGGGKRIIMQVAKILIAHLDWGMSARDALAAPNIFFGGQALLVEKGTPLAAMADRVAALGQTVVTSDLRPSKANAAERTGAGWTGAADPRSEGTALNE